MQQHPSSTAAFPTQRWNLWLRALGALVACAGGFLAYSFMQESGSIVSLTVLFLLTILVSSFVGALLWRTWWALLTAPAALWLGAVTGDVAYRTLNNIPIGAGAVVMALDLLVIAALPAVAGAAAGASVGIWLERRSSQRLAT